MKDRRLTLTRALRDRSRRDGHRAPTVVPYLRVQGQWMEQAGFSATAPGVALPPASLQSQVGDRVRVQVERGRLILTDSPHCSTCPNRPIGSCLRMASAS